MNEVEPFSFRTPCEGTPVEVTEEHLESARQLIAEGWHQVSRAYRTLARLPDGKTGVEALIDAELRSKHPHFRLREWAEGLGERSAGNHYLRCYAKQDLNWCELDVPTFVAFRKLGGGTYL